MRVAVVGAGIGGLTLAHALRRRGVDCVVLDRDAGPGATDGYRLHLTVDAFAALTEVLPESSVRALRECGAGNDAFRQFAVLDHLGRTRLRISIELALAARIGLPLAGAGLRLAQTARNAGVPVISAPASSGERGLAMKKPWPRR